MTTTLNPTLIKDQVSVAGLLARLGYQPARPGGRELVYRSMLRDDDDKPSFSVNDNLGVWYDHGTGKGGNVIDFGVAYWPQLEFREVLAKIWEVAQQAVPECIKPVVTGRRRRAMKLPHYQVENIKELGATRLIGQYLQNRGVLSVAPGRLSEVYYYVDDEKGQRKYFFAAGHQNELGGWEVRNKYFKGCLGQKSLTMIAGDERKLILFEGYFDYLSWLFEHYGENPSVIVLNGLAMLESAIRLAMQYPVIDLYFDFNKPGRQATRSFIKALPYATDRSVIYQGYHDYNDKRKVEARAEREAQQPKDLFKNVKVPFER
jgi:hypothetical protein